MQETSRVDVSCLGMFDTGCRRLAESMCYKCIILSKPTMYPSIIFSDLLSEYCEWLPESLQEKLKSLWPPLDDR